MNEERVVLTSKENILVFQNIDNEFRLVYIGKKEKYKNIVKENVNFIIKNNRAKSSCTLYSQYGTSDFSHLF